MNESSPGGKKRRPELPPVQPEIRTLSRRNTVLLLLVFFGSIFGFSWIMTKGNKAGLDELRVKGSAKQAFYQCQGVQSGDTLLVVPSVRQGDSFIRKFFKRLRDEADTIVVGDPPKPVRIIGIEAPPLQPGPQADAFAARIGVSAEALLTPRSAVTKKNWGEVARNALKVWIYKQNIRLDFPEPSKDEAHAVVNNIDFGMVVLRDGMAITTDEAHEFAESYKQFEAEAKRQRKGVWSIRN